VYYEEYQDDPVGFGEEELGEKYTDDIKKVMESVRDFETTLVKSCNGPGKTHCAASIASWFFKSFDDSQVYTVAPTGDHLKKLLWGEIGALVIRNPKLFSQCKQNVLNIERNPKSFLTGVMIPTTGTEAQRQAKFSGKHAPHLLFIVDEGDAVPEEVFKGIESCMSGGHARLLILFNPRSEAGPVYRMERDGRANIVTLSAFDHPNVVTGENLFDGAVNRETTGRRINQWCRKLVEGETIDSECFELPEFMVGYIARNQKGIPYPPLVSGWWKITDPAFPYMVLGAYPAQAVNQLISKEWVMAARARWDVYVKKMGEKPPKGSVGKMGQDCADMGNDLNSACFRYGSWVDRLEKWGGLDPYESAERARDLYYLKPNIKSTAVESNGVGAGVAPHMMRLGCNAHKIMVTEAATEETEMGKFGVIRDQLLWNVRDWLRTDSNSMLPPDEQLIEELLVLNYSVPKGNIKVMDTDTIREELKRSPDGLMSLAMTFATVKNRANVYINKPIIKKQYPW
jgi:hypothetical protein